MAEIDYNALTKALSSRRFLPEVYDTAEEAKRAALEIIGTKSVGIGGSATVRDMKLAEALQENGNEVYWHWLAAKEAKQAARDKALNADVYMCSTNALTMDGRLVNIDGTGNRAAGLIYGPHEVVVIAGTNKIVNGLDEAIDRIKRESIYICHTYFESHDRKTHQCSSFCSHQHRCVFLDSKRRGFPPDGCER